MGRKNTPVLSVCEHSLSGLSRACLLGFLWLVAVVSCLVVKKNHPNPKSGRDLDPDKLVSALSCQEDVTDPAILHPSLCFSFMIPKFLT